MTASPAPQSSSRGRIIGARVLLVVGVLLIVVSILSTYVKREALDPDQFKQTSQELIANPAIQQQVAAVMVDAFYANVDVSAELKGRLPVEPAAARRPRSQVSRRASPTGRRRSSSRGPGCRTRSSRSRRCRRRSSSRCSTATRRLWQRRDGNVVLDLRPLVLKLGDRFGFVSNLADKIPQGSAQVTILKSEDLDTAQKVTHWLEQIANFIWIFAVAAFVGAIWLARGRRRQEVRALGIGLAVVGILVLLVRSLAGKYLVDNLVVSETVRPAASDAWDIITRALAASGWVALSVGVLVAVGAWLVGPGARATSARAAVAPTLSRPGLAWGVVRRRDGAARSGFSRFRCSGRPSSSSSRQRSGTSSSSVSWRAEGRAPLSPKPCAPAPVEPPEPPDPS